MDVELFRRRLQTIVLGEIGRDCLDEVRLMLLVLGQERAQNLVYEGAQFGPIADLKQQAIEPQVIERDHLATPAEAQRDLGGTACLRV